MEQSWIITWTASVPRLQGNMYLHFLTLGYGASSTGCCLMKFGVCMFVQMVKLFSCTLITAVQCMNAALLQGGSVHWRRRCRCPLKDCGALKLSIQQFDWRCPSQPMNSTVFSGFCPDQFLYTRHLEQSLYNEALVVFVNWPFSTLTLLRH